MKVSINAPAAALGISAISFGLFSMNAKITSLESKINALEGAHEQPDTQLRLQRRQRRIMVEPTVMPEDMDTFGFVEELSVKPFPDEMSMALLSSAENVDFVPASFSGKAGKKPNRKNAICYSDKTVELMVRQEGEGVVFDEFDGHFDFTTLKVGSHQDILVDVSASTGSFWFQGNDYDAQEFTLVGDTPGDNEDYAYVNWKSVAGARVSLGIELIAPDGTRIPSLPQSTVTLSSNQDVIYQDQDDIELDDGWYYQYNTTENHNAKFFFPNLEDGYYDIKVRVFIRAEGEMIELYDDEWTMVSKVVLGPHVIIASVVDIEDSECAAATEIRKRKTRN